MQPPCPLERWGRVWPRERRIVDAGKSGPASEAHTGSRGPLAFVSVVASPEGRSVGPREVPHDSRPATLSRRFPAPPYLCPSLNWSGESRDIRRARRRDSSSAGAVGREEARRVQRASRAPEGGRGPWDRTAALKPAHAHLCGPRPWSPSASFSPGLA